MIRVLVPSGLDVRAARADLVPRIKALSDADRELDATDVLWQPGPSVDTWLQRLTVGKLLAVDTTGSILLQVRGMIFGQTDPDDGPYQILAEMMGPESSFNRSITMRAARASAPFRSSYRTAGGLPYLPNFGWA